MKKYSVRVYSCLEEIDESDVVLETDDLNEANDEYDYQQKRYCMVDDICIDIINNETRELIR